MRSPGLPLRTLPSAFRTRQLLRNRSLTLLPVVPRAVLLCCAVLQLEDPMKAIAVLCVAVLGASLVSAASNCQGAGYDLTSLAGVDMSGSDTSYKYVLQLCGTATEASCKTNGGNMCQYTNANPPVYSHVLTKWDTSGVWSTCTDATNCPNGGFQGMPTRPSSPLVPHHTRRAFA